MKFVILSGGSGARLWPLSRELSPKALLPLIGKKTLLQNTFELALSFTKSKNIVTITNIRQESDTKLQLKKIEKNPLILLEPVAKNTTAAVLASLKFLESEKDDIVTILPCDFIHKLLVLSTHINSFDYS
jgi:mannose-1-phosphate guanylyltransferase